MPLSTLAPDLKRHASEKHKATLDWVNKIRVDELDVEPLEDLVPGNRGHCPSCPIAESLVHGTRLIARTTWQHTTLHNVPLSPPRVIHHPEPVRDFISLFDKGWLPELEL